MNSGFTATLQIAGETTGPLPARSAGMSRPAIVPGSTVLRSTTVKRPARPRRPRPICSPTRSIAEKSGWPFRCGGVPTQISARSVLATASSLEQVARRRRFAHHLREQLAETRFDDRRLCRR